MPLPICAQHLRDKVAALEVQLACANRSVREKSELVAQGLERERRLAPLLAQQQQQQQQQQQRSRDDDDAADAEAARAVAASTLAWESNVVDNGGPDPGRLKLHCELCGLALCSERDRIAHEQGKKHKAKLAAVNGEAPEPSSEAEKKKTTEEQEKPESSGNAGGGGGGTDKNGNLDPYEVLGCATAADAKEIKKLFRSLSLKYHPDKNIGDAAASQKFAEITVAYAILTGQDASLFLVCELCGLALCSERDRIAHEQGKKHKAKLAAVNGEASEPSSEAEKKKTEPSRELVAPGRADAGAHAPPTAWSPLDFFGLQQQGGQGVGAPAQPPLSPHPKAAARRRRKAARRARETVAAAAAAANGDPATATVAAEAAEEACASAALRVATRGCAKRARVRSLALFSFADEEGGGACGPGTEAPHECRAAACPPAVLPAVLPGVSPPQVGSLPARMPPAEWAALRVRRQEARACAADLVRGILQRVCPAPPLTGRPTVFTLLREAGENAPGAAKGWTGPTWLTLKARQPRSIPTLSDDWEMALWAFRTMIVLYPQEWKPRFPEVRFFGEIILACGRRGRAEEAVQVFAAMCDRGVAPDVRVINNLISAHGKAGQWKEALRLLTALPARGIEPDRGTFTAAIGACGKGGQWQKALELLAEMKTHGIEANQSTYSKAMSACGEAREWKKALELLVELKARGIEPDTWTYNIAIRACEKGGQWERALEFLAEMQESGIESVAYTYSLVISACEKGGHWEKALEFLAEMQARGHKPDVHTYSTAISACEKGGRSEQTLQLLGEMQTRGIDVRVIANNTGSTSQYKLYTESDRLAYDAAIAVCGKGGQWEQALYLLAVMPARGVQPTVVTYNAAIWACRHSRKGVKAMELLAEMKTRGIQPTVQTYNAAMGAAVGACGVGGKWLEAMELLAEMKTRGIEPTAATYNQTISACGKSGRWEKALELLAEMKTHGIEPNVSTYNSAISACDEGGQWAEALELLTEMQTRDIVPNISTFCSLKDTILACEKSGDYPEKVSELKAEIKALDKKGRRALRAAARKGAAAAGGPGALLRSGDGAGAAPGAEAEGSTLEKRGSVWFCTICNVDIGTRTSVHIQGKEHQKHMRETPTVAESLFRRLTRMAPVPVAHVAQTAVATAATESGSASDAMGKSTAATTGRGSAGEASVAAANEEVAAAAAAAAAAASSAVNDIMVQQI